MGILGEDTRLSNMYRLLIVMVGGEDVMHAQERGEWDAINSARRLIYALIQVLFSKQGVRRQ